MKCEEARLFLCYLSIGLQVSLCQCSSSVLSCTGTGSGSGGTGGSDNISSGRKYNLKNWSDLYSISADFERSGSDSEIMASSNVNEEEAAETDHLLSGENMTRIDEASSSTNSRTEQTIVSTTQSPVTKQPPSQIQPPSDGESTPPAKKELPHHHHHFQFKRKFNFRSDSVFSDVLPSSSNQDCQKAGGEPEKSGSLSSLKPKESKWVTLKKKLGKGKLNSSASASSAKDKEHKDKEKTKTAASLENKSGSKSGTLREKRSLLQRAKTLAILPTNRLKEREDMPPPKRPQKRPPSEHPELFNVGGEIDMIPLELLININDLHISK